MNVVSQLLLDGMARLHISRKELAARAGIAAQSVSSFIAGKRQIPLETTVVLDSILNYEKGTIARKQLEDRLSIINCELKDKRLALIAKIKDAGGFWSYNSLPIDIEDDKLIEYALMFLDLEELPLLNELWSARHIKKVWREHLVPQGKRLNILNFLLATQYFHCKNSMKFIS